MLSSFLFTPKQQRLLATVLLNPDQEYSFAALQEAAPGSVSSLHAYVNALAAAGVLCVRQQRASKLYSANTQHPLFPELRSIAVKSFAVAEPIRQALAPLQASIEQAFIFGSTATGMQTHASDIDLMVVGRLSVGKLRLALQSAQEGIGRPIHLNVYGSNEFEALVKTDPVLRSIWEGPKIELQIRDGGDAGDGHAGRGRPADQDAVRLAAGPAVPKKRRHLPG